MKVFVHLNHQRNEDYLLIFPKTVTTGKLRRILGGGYESAVRLLMTKSEKKIFVPPADKQKALMVADFCLMDGCTTERLA